MPFYKTGTWVCPANVTTVQVECWGGGGGGGGDNTTNAGGGGGGGQYARANSLAVSPGTSYTVTVGTAGTGGTSATSGGDSWFSTTLTVLAKGGAPGSSATSGTPAGGSGAVAGSVGDVKFNGGNGGAGDFSGIKGGGGGGGAGSVANGGNGGSVTAGNGGAAFGGIGGTGANNGAPGNPKAIAAGGAGGDSFAGSATGGTGGAVFVTYTTSPLPTTSANDININNSTSLQNLAVDDGDYFIQYGSEYMIQEYKKKWINNTDTIIFTWKGRSTLSTLISPVLIQIYNVNSATWETLARVNKTAADTDFQVTVTQSSNVSNYYDSSNIVTFRSYQQVI